jgi:hypothetical protein
MRTPTLAGRLRGEIRQLAAAAATDCLRDRLTLPRSRSAKTNSPLIELDTLAEQLAAPALRLIDRLEEQL